MLNCETNCYLACVLIVFICVYAVTLIMMCSVLESFSEGDIISTVNHSLHLMTSGNHYMYVCVTI